MDEGGGCLSTLGGVASFIIFWVGLIVVMGFFANVAGPPIGLLAGAIWFFGIIGFLVFSGTKDTSSSTRDIPMSPVTPVSPRSAEPRKDFDISDNDIRVFYDQLQASLNAGQPLFLFTKRRRNDNIALDNNYQQLIINKIAGLRKLSEEYLNLKAEEIFSEEYLDNLIRDKKAAAERAFELAVQNHKKALKIIDNDIEVDDARVVDIKADADRKRFENETIKEQNESIKIKNEMEKRRVDFYDNVISKLDLSKFPPAYQVYIISKFLDMDPDKFSKLDLEAEMKDIILAQAKAEADKKAAEAESANLDNDNKRESYKRNTNKKP